MSLNPQGLPESEASARVLTLLGLTLPFHLLAIGGNLSLFDILIVPSLVYLLYSLELSAGFLQLLLRIALVYGIFAALSVLSIFYFQDPSRSTPNFLMAHAKVIWLVLYLVLSLLLVQGSGFRNVAFRLALTLGALNCVFIILGDTGVWQQSEKTRLTGPFHNPNIFGNFLCFSIFLNMITCAWLGPVKWRILFLGILLLQIYGLMQTGSRGAAATFLFGAILIFVYVSTQAPKIMGKAAAALAALAIVLGSLQMSGAIDLSELSFVARFTKTVEGEGPAVVQRIELWETAWTAFLQSPVFGVGYGCYGVVAGAINYHIDGMVAHNTYLSYLVECGVVGLAFLSITALLALGLILYKGWRHVGLRDSWICLPYVIGTASQGFVANVDNYRSLWLGMGFCLAALIYRDEEAVG